MTKATKFSQVITILRSEIDFNSISDDRYDKVLADDGFVRVVQAVLSGKITIDLDDKLVIFH